eukprot:TRINITY_DN62254_c0_g1_i1.p1 TRINITY_DN62254_c0_g1~~TRINITY_DN62254_c0_g1_i1.p1  ORF type:complete len:1105 (-),score=70.13 TRINITY_DN62254_c0_g1_i1:18-3158(-)
MATQQATNGAPPIDINWLAPDKYINFGPYRQGACRAFSSQIVPGLCEVPDISDVNDFRWWWESSIGLTVNVRVENKAPSVIDVLVVDEDADEVTIAAVPLKTTPSLASAFPVHARVECKSSGTGTFYVWIDAPGYDSIGFEGRLACQDAGFPPTQAPVPTPTPIPTAEPPAVDLYWVEPELGQFVSDGACLSLPNVNNNLLTYCNIPQIQTLINQFHIEWETTETDRAYRLLAVINSDSTDLIEPVEFVGLEGEDKRQGFIPVKGSGRNRAPVFMRVRCLKEGRATWKTILRMEGRQDVSFPAALECKGKGEPVSQAPTATASVSSTTWGNIRFAVSAHLLDDDPGRQCTRVGEVVRVGELEDNLLGQPGLACSRELPVDCWYMCANADVVTPNQKSRILQTLESVVLPQLSELYQVPRLIGNLRLTAQLRFRCPDIPLHQTHLLAGAQGVDYLVYVVARPMGYLGDVIATASECQQADNGRPVFGFININPQETSVRNAKFADFLLHEMHHALGFSAGKFAAVLGPKDQFQTILSKTVPSYNLTVISSPKVLELAREHFNCPSLRGVELENGGSSGTGSSHWEKRILVDDLMTGAAVEHAKLTSMTLGVMEDLGFYRPNYTLARDTLWGKLQGCPFVEGLCGNTWPAEVEGTSTAGSDGPRYICTALEGFASRGCTMDHRDIGKCNLVRYNTPIEPSQFRYFPADARLGGSDVLLDYCPVFLTAEGGDCEQETLNSRISLDRGEFYGTSRHPTEPGQYNWLSRCHRAQISPAQSPFGNDILLNPACFPTVCTGGILRVRVGEIWFPCPWGKFLELEAVNQAPFKSDPNFNFKIRTTQYHGLMECPRAGENFCTKSYNHDMAFNDAWPTITSIRQTGCNSITVGVVVPNSDSCIIKIAGVNQLTSYNKQTRSFTTNNTRIPASYGDGGVDIILACLDRLSGETFNDVKMFTPPDGSPVLSTALCAGQSGIATGGDDDLVSPSLELSESISDEATESATLSPSETETEDADDERPRVSRRGSAARSASTAFVVILPLVLVMHWLTCS